MVLLSCFLPAVMPRLMADQDARLTIQSLEAENQRLRRAIDELSIINDLARAISASLDPQEIMETIIRRSLQAVHAEQGVITLIEQDAVDPMKTLVRAAVSSEQHGPFHLTQALVGWMQLNKRPLLMNNPRVDERFRGVRWDDSIRSLLCVPMMIKSELKGVLAAYNKKRGELFSEDDQRLLAIIAAQSAQVIENARLNDREKQLLKIQEEMRLAAKIQSDLLPTAAPPLAGYDIAGKSIPAQTVGGDYFDFITIDDHRLALCLGDVSGKGLPAALLMANLQATLRSQALASPSVKDCIGQANALLFQSTSTEKFVTLFYGVLDSWHHVINFCNAGHDPPFLFTSSEPPTRLTRGGIVLSALKQFPFEQQEIDLAPGDLLAIYSDGITEAMNPQGELFGEERLEEAIRRHREESAAVAIESTILDVKSFAAGANQADDITLVMVKRRVE